MEPVANLTVTPQPAFPGDAVTVTNTSLSGTRFATWVTDGPGAHTDQVLSGSLSFSTGTSLLYTLPAAMASGDVFYAHAAVETDEFLYVAGQTPGQLKTQQITIDRTPEATITITPAAAITGGTVNLSASAEGHPGGDAPFEWTVTDPAQEQTFYSGPSGHTVTLTQSGLWNFDLVVQYEHDTAGQPGVPYETTAQATRNISSVAASFGISPSNPLHNQTITLTSSSAAQTGASSRIRLGCADARHPDGRQQSELVVTASDDVD